MNHCEIITSALCFEYNPIFLFKVFCSLIIFSKHFGRLWIWRIRRKYGTWSAQRLVKSKKSCAGACDIVDILECISGCLATPKWAKEYRESFISGCLATPKWVKEYRESYTQESEDCKGLEMRCGGWSQNRVVEVRVICTAVSRHRQKNVPEVDLKDLNLQKIIWGTGRGNTWHSFFYSSQPQKWFKNVKAHKPCVSRAQPQSFDGGGSKSWIATNRTGGGGG